MTSVDNTTVGVTAFTSPVTTKVVQVPSNVIPFKGNDTTGAPGWTPGPTVDEFTSQLEAYFAAERITEDSMKISEAKRYIHPSQGDAHLTVRYTAALDKAVLWPVFKDVLIQLYRETRDADPYAVVEEICGVHWSPKESLLSYLARLSKLTQELKAAVRTRCQIEICEQTARIIMIGLVRRELAPESQQRLLEKADPSKDLVPGIKQVFTDANPKRQHKYQAAILQDIVTQPRVFASKPKPQTNNWTKVDRRGSKGPRGHPVHNQPRKFEVERRNYYAPLANMRPNHSAPTQFRGNSRKQANRSYNGDRNQVICYGCQKRGHYRNECPEAKNKGFVFSRPSSRNSGSINRGNPSSRPGTPTGNRPRNYQRFRSQPGRPSGPEVENDSRPNSFLGQGLSRVNRLDTNRPTASSVTENWETWEDLLSREEQASMREWEEQNAESMVRNITIFPTARSILPDWTLKRSYAQATARGRRLH